MRIQHCPLGRLWHPQFRAVSTFFELASGVAKCASEVEELRHALEGEAKGSAIFKRNSTGRLNDRLGIFRHELVLAGERKGVTILPLCQAISRCDFSRCRR